MIILNKILIVDDSSYMRFNLKKIVHKHGDIALMEAKNGEEAVAAIKAQEFDLVLMDITMPVMDGLTAITYIMKIKPDQNIVIVSSEGEEQTIAEALNMGAKDFILKPFNEKQIMSLLNKFF